MIMKAVKFKFLAFVFLFMIAVFTPSCEALLDALVTPTTQVDDEKNDDVNKSSKGKTQGTNDDSNSGDTNTGTSKGKK